MAGAKNNNNDTRRTLLVALVLCLVCSVVVAGTAVLLKPLQLSNQLADRKKNILIAANLLETSAAGDAAIDINALYEKHVEARLVELRSGEYSDAYDPQIFDARKASRDPQLSEQIDPDDDIASIKRQANYAPVYLISDGQGDVSSVVLPVHGYGLWSTMYGFLALTPDTRTIVGLKFYDHGETPGLGGEIDNADWLAQWQGRVIYDEQWQPDIKIAKGKATSEDEVDGLAGATLTSRGVLYLLQYWLSEQGYGVYLERLRGQELAARAS